MYGRRFLRVSLLGFSLWWGACAANIQSLATGALAAVRAEQAAVSSLVDLNQVIEGVIQDKDSLSVWQAKRSEIYAGFLQFHNALSEFVKLLLGPNALAK